MFFRKEWHRIPICGVGYLFFVKGGAGESVSAGKPHFKIADLSRVYVRAYFTTAQLSGLIGPDWAGKTSLFRILTTLSLPQGSERGEKLPARPRLSMHLLRGEELPEDRVGSRGYFCTTLSGNVVVPAAKLNGMLDNIGVSFSKSNQSLFHRAASLRVVDEAVDGRMSAADRAGVRPGDDDGMELHRPGVEAHKAVREEFSRSGDVFECLGGLDGTHHSGDGAQHTRLRTGRHCAGWRRFLEHTAVAGSARQVREGLTLEAQDAAVRKGFALHHAGVVDKVFRREVVGALHHEVIFPDELEGIGGVEKFLIGVHAHVGVDGLHFRCGALDFGSSEICGEMYDLTLEVAQVHYVSIHDADAPDAGRRKIEADGGAQATGSYDQDLGVAYPFLPLYAHILQKDMARIALQLFIGKVAHRLVDTGDACKAVGLNFDFGFTKVADDGAACDFAAKSA